MPDPVAADGPIALCLSGGGFRAALYALGVARYLGEAGLLSRVHVVSGVSGGSVAAAALVDAVAGGGIAALSADRFEADVFEPFLATVSDASLRGRALRRWVMGRATFRGQPRNEVLAGVLCEALFPRARHLGSLPGHPQLVIVATDLSAGRAFRFAGPFVGSWDLGYATPRADLTVATAVAASAAAPPLIPPLQLRTAGLGFTDPPPVVSLTDGGVYDNLGIEWFQGWADHRRPPGAVRCTDLIVVNASGPLTGKQSAYRGLRALNRMRKIQYVQTQATRIRWFVAELESGRQHGAYLGITGDPRRYRLPSGESIAPALAADALPSALVAPIAALRTDFNRFSMLEARLLAYHGYHSAHARMGSLRPHEATTVPRWREFAGMTEEETTSMVAQLSGRRHRVGIGERLR